MLFYGQPSTMVQCYKALGTCGYIDVAEGTEKNWMKMEVIMVGSFDFYGVKGYIVWIKATETFAVAQNVNWFATAPTNATSVKMEDMVHRYCSKLLE